MVPVRMTVSGLHVVAGSGLPGASVQEPSMRDRLTGIIRCGRTGPRPEGLLPHVRLMRGAYAVPTGAGVPGQPRRPAGPYLRTDP